MNTGFWGAKCYHYHHDHDRSRLGIMGRARITMEAKAGSPDNPVSEPQWLPHDVSAGGSFSGRVHMQRFLCILFSAAFHSVAKPPAIGSPLRSWDVAGGPAHQEERARESL